MRPTSLLEASTCPSVAAPALRLCEWHRYQRWMVTAATFTWWMNLQGKERGRGHVSLPTTHCSEYRPPNPGRTCLLCPSPLRLLLRHLLPPEQAASVVAHQDVVAGEVLLQLCHTAALVVVMGRGLDDVAEVEGMG